MPRDRRRAPRPSARDFALRKEISCRVNDDDGLSSRARADALNLSALRALCTSRAFRHTCFCRGKDLGAPHRKSMTVAASALAGTPVAVSDSRLRAVASTCAFWGVCLWLLVMPFEATRPLLHLPGQSISSAEAALFFVFAGFGFALFAQFEAGSRPARLRRAARSLVDSA